MPTTTAAPMPSVGQVLFLAVPQQLDQQSSNPVAAAPIHLSTTIKSFIADSRPTRSHS